MNIELPLLRRRLTVLDSTSDSARVSTLFDGQLYSYISVLARMGQSGTTPFTPNGALLRWQNTKFPNGARPPWEVNTAVKSASGYDQSGAPSPLGANVAVISASGYGHNFQR